MLSEIIPIKCSVNITHNKKYFVFVSKTVRSYLLKFYVEHLIANLT